MPKKSLKILLWNIGYCTGINGSYVSYLTKPHHYLHTPKQTFTKVKNEFHSIVKKENPDIICLIEVKKQHFQSLAPSDYKQKGFSVKYDPKSTLTTIPIFKDNGNAFFSKTLIKHKKLFLKNGTKKLLYQIQLNKSTDLFFFHFSLNKSTRKKQFEELTNLFNKKNNKNTILCGDFNIFSGKEELKPLLSKTNIKLSQVKNTFPSKNPKKPLDLFIHSKNLSLSTKVLPTNLSDHLPVIAEVKL